MLFPPCAVQRFKEYSKLREEAPDEVFLMDIEHWPGFGPAPGPDFPCLVTRGKVIMFKRGECKQWTLATGNEHLFAQGFNMWPNLCGKKFPCARLRPEMSQLEPYQKKLRAGNSMNLIVQASWMIYVLANIRRVEKTCIRSLSMPEGDDSEGEASCISAASDNLCVSPLGSSGQSSEELLG